MLGRRSLPALVVVALLLVARVPSPSDWRFPSAARRDSVSGRRARPPRRHRRRWHPDAPQVAIGTATPSPPTAPPARRSTRLTSALPVRDTAFRVGTSSVWHQGRRWPLLAIPDSKTRSCRPRRPPPGPARLAAPARGSNILRDRRRRGGRFVRAVCIDDAPEALGFDHAGRPLDGWPARLPQADRSMDRTQGDRGRPLPCRGDIRRGRVERH